jgi:hypothetical protein
MPDCSDIRKRWDEAFDAGRDPSASITRHLAHCDPCAAYTEAASGVREALTALPLGVVNDAADQAILTTLRSERRSAAPVQRPALSLVLAGVGSFALTMVVAGVMLSAASGTPSPPMPAGPAGVARTPLPETNAALDAWLESPGLVTGAPTFRPVSAPEPPRRAPLRGQVVRPRSLA